jgi:hypothetical protein
VVSGRAEGEIVDFQVVIDSPEAVRLYIDRTIIEEAARELFGMVPAGRAKQLEEQHAYEKGRAEDLQETLDTAAQLEERRPGAINRKELAGHAR